MTRRCLCRGMAPAQAVWTCGCASTWNSFPAQSLQCQHHPKVHVLRPPGDVLATSHASGLHKTHIVMQQAKQSMHANAHGVRLGAHHLHRKQNAVIQAMNCSKNSVSPTAPAGVSFVVIQSTNAFRNRGPDAHVSTFTASVLSAVQHTYCTRSVPFGNWQQSTHVSLIHVATVSFSTSAVQLVENLPSACSTMPAPTISHTIATIKVIAYSTKNQRPKRCNSSKKTTGALLTTGVCVHVRTMKHLVPWF